MLDQFAMHSWTSIRFVMFLQSNRLDGPEDLHLLRLGCRGPTTSELVVRSRGDLQNSKQHRIRSSMAVLADELQPQPFSFAKKAVAFLKMSRSMMTGGLVTDTGRRFKFFKRLWDFSFELFRNDFRKCCEVLCLLL